MPRWCSECVGGTNGYLGENALGAMRMRALAAQSGRGYAVWVPTRRGGRGDSSERLAAMHSAISLRGMSCSGRCSHLARAIAGGFLGLWTRQRKGRPRLRWETPSGGSRRQPLLGFLRRLANGVQQESGVRVCWRKLGVLRSTSSLARPLWAASARAAGPAGRPLVAAVSPLPMAADRRHTTVTRVALDVHTCPAQPGTLCIRRHVSSAGHTAK